MQELNYWFEKEGIDHEALMEYMGDPKKAEFGMRSHRIKFGM
jgi:hypothetical protein